ncbi:tumor necrosis factor ligand superfamily member 15 [Bombina bombina]|uniref:tumor necrosis factor ligand superfamily member 15 n=1 Tax=Bombina bombina TaxID=8345 RepID=UPI00235B2571|nr:tumor necrosis factor ligand superfamily member 15 [Bombina bombina]
MLNKDNKALIQTTNEIALAYKNPDMTHNNVEKPRAHLTGTKQDYSSQQNQTLQWEHYRGLAFTEFGMEYSNRSLHIPKTGYYYIYAQVSFRSVGYECSANDQKASRKKFISQMIAKINDNYPEPEVLLSGTKSLCEKESEMHHPIYLGALLYMMEGDQIMVNVSDIKLVDVTVEHRTYFGAFLV